MERGQQNPFVGNGVKWVKPVPMKPREIRQLVTAQTINMGGFLVEQALPMDGVDQIDPFLLIHHATKKYSGKEDPKDAGVGPHPHRGFAPVTFVFQGGVHSPGLKTKTRE